MKKVSVIVPVYNTEKYLKKCINSIINQSIGFKNIELIIINDGSSDNSEEIIKCYQKEYKSIKYLKQKNSGQGSARNAGIGIATGEYIIFVDSDDYLDLNAIEKLYEYAIKTKSDIIVFNSVIVKNETEIKEKSYSLFDVAVDLKYIISDPSPCNKLVKASILKDNKCYFPKGKFYEDLAIVPTWIFYTKNVAFLDEYLYYYVQRENSTMNKTKYNKKLEDIFWVLDYLSDNFKRNNLYEKYFNEIEYIYIQHLLNAASLRFLAFDNQTANLDKVVEIIKKQFPKWYKNKYFKKRNLKYRVMCYLLYNKNYKLISILRKKK